MIDFQGNPSCLLLLVAICYIVQAPRNSKFWVDQTKTSSHFAEEGFTPGADDCGDSYTYGSGMHKDMIVEHGTKKESDCTE